MLAVDCEFDVLRALEAPVNAWTDCVQSPTDFWLDTYPITQVFDNPALLSSLASYSERQSGPDLLDKRRTTTGAESVLFLRVQAAASYFSTNRTLMEQPQPVDVDISEFECQYM